MNEIFDAFPDYDVFDEREPEIGKTERDNILDDDFIEYDEKRDFRNKKPEKKQGRVKRFSPQEPEHSDDYRDGFGVYTVYEERVKNYGTVFYFPLLIIWLESVLRLGCGEGLLSLNMIFVVLFSLPFASLLTILCTFFGEKLNRALANIITALLTLWYCMQTVHFNISGSFLLLSDYTPLVETLEDFNVVMNVMSDKIFYLLACFAPFVVSLFAGKYIFPFRRIRVPAKACLLLAAVLLHLIAITGVSFDRKTESYSSNYSIYHEYFDGNKLQENFGLYTMQRKDIFRQ